MTPPANLASSLSADFRRRFLGRSSSASDEGADVEEEVAAGEEEEPEPDIDRLLRIPATFSTTFRFLSTSIPARSIPFPLSFTVSFWSARRRA